MNNLRRFTRKPIPALETTASLIWHPDQWKTYYETPINSYCMFRYSFSLEKDGYTGSLKVFADSKYLLWVNGSLVSRGPARSNPSYQYYDEPDISPFLRIGQNTIAVLALYYGYGTGHSMKRIPCVFCDGTVTNGEGHSVSLQSNGNWKCKLCDAFLSSAPRMNGCKGPCQILDMNAYEDNWILTDYDDSHWDNCATRKVNRSSPFFNLLPRPIPLLKETKVDTKGSIAEGILPTLKEETEIHLQIKKECDALQVEPHAPKALPAEMNSASFLILDFEKITTGYLNLSVNANAGDLLDVVFCEELTPENRPYFDGISYRPVARWILKEGENHLQSFFHYDALRYVCLIYRGKHCEINDAFLTAISYPMEQESTFHTKQKNLQKLWDISVHTLKLCMLDGFLDSPSREQQQWMGDARWQAIYNAYLSGDMRMAKKILYQFAQSQDYEGMIASRYPDENINLAPIPTYCFQWINAFYDYYQFTKDLKPAEDLFDHMIRAMRWFTAFEGEKGLLWNLPYWDYYGGGISDQGKRGDYYGNCANGVVNLMYLESLKTMVFFAEKLQDTEALAYYRETMTKQKEALCTYLWNEDMGCMIDSVKPAGKTSSSVSELVNALALLHLYEPGSSQAGKILDRVFRDNETVVRMDVYSMLLYIRALLKHKEGDLAVKETLKRYGNMLDSGATAVWEAWELFRYDKEGKLIGMKSACHAWGSAPIVLIAEGLCGLSYEEGQLKKEAPCITLTDDFEASLVTPGENVELSQKLSVLKKLQNLFGKN